MIINKIYLGFSTVRLFEYVLPEPDPYNTYMYNKDIVLLTKKFELLLSCSSDIFETVKLRRSISSIFEKMIRKEFGKELENKHFDFMFTFTELETESKKARRFIFNVFLSDMIRYNKFTGETMISTTFYYEHFGRVIKTQRMRYKIYVYVMNILFHISRLLLNKDILLINVNIKNSSTIQVSHDYFHFNKLRDEFLSLNLFDFSLELYILYMYKIK